MKTEADLLKEIAKAAGYKFEADANGIVRMLNPAGEICVPTPEPSLPPVSLPEDVQQGPDGFYFREVARVAEDGTVTLIPTRVCEDCWEVIPKYVDFPRGIVSPELETDMRYVKRKWVAIGNTEAWQPLAKAVCLPCYIAAYQRVYPEGIVPTLNTAIVEQLEVYTPEPDKFVFLGEPKGA